MPGYAVNIPLTGRTPLPGGIDGYSRPLANGGPRHHHSFRVKRQVREV